MQGNAGSKLASEEKGVGAKSTVESGKKRGGSRAALFGGKTGRRIAKKVSARALPDLGQKCLYW